MIDDPTPSSIAQRNLAMRLIRESPRLETPILLVDRDAICQNVARWRAHLPFVELHYAVKANNDPLIVQTLVDQGCSFDVASEYELQLAAQLGAAPEKLLLSHPAKSRRTLEAIARYRPWGIAVDTQGELKRVREAAKPSSGYQPTLFVRLATHSENIQDDLSLKFGCAPLPAVDLLRQARAFGFESLGLSFHVGTQCYDIGNYEHALQLALTVADAAAAQGLQITALDIGGGFCDERVAQARGVSHDRLFESLRELLTPIRGRFRLVAEPGRYIVADAGALLVSILSVDPGHEKLRQVIVDEHIYGSLCGEKFDSRYYSFVRINERKEGLSAPISPCNIFGGTCDSVDRFATRDASYHLLPSDLEIDEYLFVDCMGAYSTSSGASFNGLDPAGVLLYWRDGEVLHWQKSPFFRKSDLLLRGALADWKENDADRRANFRMEIFT